MQGAASILPGVRVTNIIAIMIALHGEGHSEFLVPMVGSPLGALCYHCLMPPFCTSNTPSPFLEPSKTPQSLPRTDGTPMSSNCLLSVEKL